MRAAEADGEILATACATIKMAGMSVKLLSNAAAAATDAV
jgi:hypothetical protein